MARAHFDDELEREFDAVAREAGCELLHFEFKGGRLRVVLDREEGVTLTDCERVSKQISALLDAHDFGSDRYTLEVSSPGLDRPLYKSADYARFVGRKIRIRFRSGEPPEPRTVTGVLAAFDERSGGLARVEDDSSGEDVEIPLETIERARLQIDF